MPPRHTYWTILFGDKPTAFRAATQEELLPTFGQIKGKHPDAVMMWFARGKLWKSEEEGRATFDRQRNERFRPRDDRPRDPRAPRPPGPPKPRSGEGGEWQNRGPKPEWRDKPRDDRPRDPRAQRPPGESQDRGPKPAGGDADRRGRDWRPGGEHKDPRDRFKVPRDVKRARFKAQARRDRTSPRPPRKKKDEE
jgi:hypothetical protein